MDFVSSTADTAAIAAEAVVLTGNSFTWRAGRAYALLFHQHTLPSVANTFVQFLVRKTNLAGAVLVAENIPTGAVAAAQMTCQSEMLIRNNTGGDVTANVVLTMSPGAGTMTGKGAATNLRWMKALDIGAAADYPNAVQI